MNSINADLIVVGGGLAGLSFGLLAARAGIRVVCLDRQPLEVQTKRGFDVRTTAIARGVVDLMAEAGIWEGCAKTARPIRKIDIMDGAGPVLLRFESADVGGEDLGYIVDNLDLRRAMADQVKQVNTLTCLAPVEVADIQADKDGVRLILADGRRLSARLLVGADGRSSQVRDHFRIRTRGWPYDHTAVVGTFRHENPHAFTALEQFTPEGPFAVLPLTDDDDGCPRSSVVWSDRPAASRTRMAMDDETFRLVLEARLPDGYGNVLAVGPRAAWPLTLIHAERYTAQRTALIADAAHGIHPIAGQGLNLGMRDVAVLARLVREAFAAGGDPGAPELLQRYERERRIDTMAMIGGTDALTWLFGSRIPGVPLARRLGLRVVEKSPFLKRFFIRQAMGASLSSADAA